MKKVEVEKLHERLDGILEQLEDLRIEIEGMYAEDDEQVHIEVDALADEFFLAKVTVLNGTEWGTVVNGSRFKGTWREYDAVRGSLVKKDDEK